jgi:hypothetical protein
MTINLKTAALAAALIAAHPTLTIAEDSHHPETTAPSAPSAPAQKMPPSPMTSSQMPADSSSMTKMMGMMMSMMGKGMHNMSDMAMPGMEMADRIEGRIAFLRAELKITQPQAKSWDSFAQALRDNAKKLGDMRPMMGMGQQANSQPAGLVQRLEQQERWYAARLSGLQSIRAALAGLYGALSDEQKKTADELMAPHLGLMPMGMGMGMGMGTGMN